MGSLYNLARMTTATVGTGTITLGSAVAPWLTFALAGVPDGVTVSYAIEDGGANSEIGTGVYTAAGTTLTRTVTKSSNSNNPISLSGSAQVYITARAEDLDVHAATSKVTPVDADELGLIDSAASNVLKKLTWANLKATLDSRYFQQNYLTGLTLSTAGASATFSIAAGQAADSANATLMTLASALSKTTSAWAVGSGNGGVATNEAIQNSVWYHSYLVRRSDTGVVDAIVSQAPSVAATITMTIASPAVVTWTGSGLEAGAPVVFTTTGALPTGVTAGTVYFVKTMVTVDTFQIAATQGGAAINTSGSQSGVQTGTSNPALPTSYTDKRRIGSMKTNGSAQWTSFVQDGDDFQWGGGAVADVGAANPGTSAVLRALSVPKGFNVRATLQVGFSTGVIASNPASILISDPAVTDIAPTTANATALNYAAAGTAANYYTAAVVRTDKSGQVRSRLQLSDANISLNINTVGWNDRRGRDG